MADELRKDQFHKNGDRIYQVMTNQDQSGTLHTIPECPGMLGEVLMQELSDVELAVSASRVDNEMTLSTNEKHIRGQRTICRPEFLHDVFFPLLIGDRRQVLADKSAIVLSADMRVACSRPQKM